MDVAVAVKGYNESSDSYMCTERIASRSSNGGLDASYLPSKKLTVPEGLAISNAGMAGQNALF